MPLKRVGCVHNLYFFFAIFVVVIGRAASMWPQPVEFQHGETVLWLADQITVAGNDARLSNDDFTSHWQGLQQVLNPNSGSRDTAFSDREWQHVEAAFDRIKHSIFQERYVPDKFYAIDFDFDPPTDSNRVYIETITVTRHAQPEGLSEYPSTEAYTLEVTEDGEVAIHAISYQGVLHALQSFRQLFYAHSDPKEGIYLPNAPVHIRDGPRFEHRGLNLDIARNRIFPRDVIRTLDAMAAQKLNKLHIHATDSQSWPLHIPSMPELAQKGAYHRSQIWSKEHLDNVQMAGNERGIDIFIEIDMPGHTASIAHSHPELTVAYGEKWDVYAMEPPAGQLKLAEPKVQEFLSCLLDDLLPRLQSDHFHVGGDELNVKSYALEPGLETSDKVKLKPYLQKFYDHVFKILEDQKRTPIAWEEIVLDWGLELPQSMIVQSWRSQKGLAEITGKGHRALFGPSSHWYLDCGFGTWADPEPDNPNTKVKPPFHDWCPPMKNWRLVYCYDPLEGIPSDHHHLVIGGEAHLWGELTDTVTLDGMLWPRLAAAAEVLWRGKREVNEDATRRLAEMRERLVARGISAGMVQMEWCLKNPHSCYM